MNDIWQYLVAASLVFVGGALIGWAFGNSYGFKNGLATERRKREQLNRLRHEFTKNRRSHM